MISQIILLGGTILLTLFEMKMEGKCAVMDVTGWVWQDRALVIIETVMLVLNKPEIEVKHIDLVLFVQWKALQSHGLQRWWFSNVSLLLPATLHVMLCWTSTV